MRCCVHYHNGLCLIPNEEQTFEDGEFNATTPEGDIYTPILSSANCIALELAEDVVRQEICDSEIPIAFPQELSTDFEAPLDIVLTGSSPFGNPLLFTITVEPLHGLLIGSGANYTYTPESGYSGPDSFEFTVSDGIHDSLPATVDITVGIQDIFSIAFDVDIPTDFCGTCECPDGVQKCYRLFCVRAFVYEANITTGVLTLGDNTVSQVRRWHNTPYGSGDPPGTVVYTDAFSSFQAHGEDFGLWLPTPSDEAVVLAEVLIETPGFEGDFTVLFVVEAFVPQCVTSDLVTRAFLPPFVNGWTGMSAGQKIAFLSSYSGIGFTIYNGDSEGVTADFAGAFPAEVSEGVFNWMAANWYTTYLTDPEFYRGLTIFFDEPIIRARDNCEDRAYRVTARATSMPQ